MYKLTVRFFYCKQTASCISQYVPNKITFIRQKLLLQIAFHEMLRHLRFAVNMHQIKLRKEQVR